MEEKFLKDDHFFSKYTEDENEINLFEIFKKLWKNKKIILYFLLIGTLFSFVAGSIYRSRKTFFQVGISFNFEEIKEGKNPDGTVFDEKKIISNKVLKNMYEEYKKLTGEELSLTDFSDYLEVRPVIPKNISVLIEKNLKEGIKYTFTPTEYFITFKSNANKEITRELLKKYIGQILNDYILKNKPSTDFAKIEINNLYSQTFVYEDYLLVINDIISDIENKIREFKKKEIKFQTDELNYTYTDVSLNLNLIKNIEIAKIIAKLDYNYKSLDLERSNVYLNQKLLDYEIENQILRKRVDVLNEMIKNYKLSTKELILASDINAELPKKDEYYSKLIDDYISSSIKIEKNSQEKIKIEKKLKELSKVDSIEDTNILEDIKTIIEHVNIEIAKVNELNKKYYEVEYSEMATQISPIDYTYIGIPQLIIVQIGIVIISFILACLYILFYENITKNIGNYKIKYKK